MDRTSIEISKEKKEQLREERLPHESNYDDTIGRLLENHSVPFLTEQEVRDVAQKEARRVVSDRVVMEAQK